MRFLLTELQAVAMWAAQSSAGVWGDASGALVWGPLTAVITLGGPGSEITVVKTESGHRVLLPLFPGGTTVALGSRGRVATPAPIHIGVGRRRVGPAKGGGRYCNGCRTNLTAGLGPDGGGGKLGGCSGREVGQLGSHLQWQPAQKHAEK